MLQEVTGRFLAPDGSPLSGSVVFTPAPVFARDAALYARSFPTGEVATVRKNLETAWK